MFVKLKSYKTGVDRFFIVHKVKSVCQDPGLSKNMRIELFYGRITTTSGDQSSYSTQAHRVKILQSRAEGI